MTITISDDLWEHLAQVLEANRAELIGSYQQVLRDVMFNGRSTMRPNMLKKIASDEADMLNEFLHQPQRNVLERGVHLHQSGLSEQPFPPRF